MIINLHKTTTSKITSALVKARSNIGTASGMVLTLVVVVDQQRYKLVHDSAREAAREHPSRMLLVVSGSGKTSQLDAEVHLGEDVPGEMIILHLNGELREHPASVVMPLLLPDSPVVAWWPGKAPLHPAEDPIGALAHRRITDAMGDATPLKALEDRTVSHAPGDTDLAWTRLTGWRALLTAALDQFPTTITGATVAAARNNASANLMAAWLESRLNVEVTTKTSAGPGMTSVSLHTPAGDISLVREDGETATYVVPGRPHRRVALHRRDINELLTEELRRLDVDDVFEATIKTLAARLEREHPESKSTTKAAS